MPGLGQNFIHAGLINKGDESKPSVDIRDGGGGEREVLMTQKLMLTCNDTL